MNRACSITIQDHLLYPPSRGAAIADALTRFLNGSLIDHYRDRGIDGHRFSFQGGRCPPTKNKVSMAGDVVEMIRQYVLTERGDRLFLSEVGEDNLIPIAWPAPFSQPPILPTPRILGDE